ncbi:MAG: methyl-accepting chemotaxis protein [Candidatus Gastranaerophilales bacterium]|nr:methyl-accepting chemotaxis protein [Candidatus Gastranaerophilales bacterium]
MAILTSVASVIQIKKAITDSAQVKIEELTEVAYNMVSFYGDKAKNGEMTVADAKKAAEQAIETYSYENGKNYIWINDYNNIMIYNPKRPFHSDCTATTGPDGKYFYKDITEMAKSGNGEFYKYKVVRKIPGGPAEGTIVDKISTAKAYKPWGWVIATGVYLTEVNEMVNKTVIIILSLNILVMLGLILVTKFFFTDKVVKDLLSLYDELNSTSNNLLSSSKNLINSSEALAKGSTEQAASVEEISASIQETSSMIDRNDENTSFAAKLSKESLEGTKKSYEKMNILMDSMEKINISSQEISKIIKVIDEISFQTNILALNAAVEAARAGEAGKGFAVVAEEVRNLAQRSTESSKDTTALIENNIILCDQSNQIAKDVHKAIVEITDKTKKVDEIMQEITVSTNEQKIGVEQISTAINQVTGILNNNAETARNTALISEDLDNEAETLNGVLSHLNSIINEQNN